jgi:phosphoglycolate phosphatase
MRRFDAVLFDLDGTLVDSQPGILATFSYTFAQFGVQLPVEQLRRFLGPPLRASFAEVLPPQQVEQAVELYRAQYAKGGMFQGAVYDGVPAMLQELKENGFTLCVATSKPQTVAQQVLEHFGLAQWFCYIGGASLDASRDTKTAVMQEVLRQSVMHNSRPLMVGDRDNDMQGAQNCGIAAAAVLYGYGSAEELMPYAPLFAAESPQQLCSWILNEKA